MSTGLPPGVPPGVTVFGPGANCTLAICPVQMSVYGYRPSLPANITFLGLYLVTAAVHVGLGLRWRTWFFMACMVFGALNAVLGYAARIAMYYNPFNFAAFMIQISRASPARRRPRRLVADPGRAAVCITSGPVYYSAAIYVTLATA